MDLRLNSKVALVTGSSRGIGKGIATAFLQEGTNVVVTGRTKTDLDTTVAELQQINSPENVFAFHGDLTDETEIERCLNQIISHWQRLDILIANVGSGRSMPGWDIQQDEWERVFKINLWGSLAVIRRAIPLMMKSGGGSVIVISSIAGLEVIGAPAPYTAAKSALNSACKSLAKDLAQHNIRMNIVAPGNILFPEGVWDKKQQENPEAVQKLLENSVPMKRFGTPEEIANVVVFIASNRASFMTGSCTVVDGGQTQTI